MKRSDDVQCAKKDVDLQVTHYDLVYMLLNTAIAQQFSEKLLSKFTHIYI
jgi:hypothetical protein